MSTLVEKLEREYKKWCDREDNSVFGGVEQLDARGRTRGLKDAIDIIKQHSDWISVDERLPKPKQEVLIDVGGKTRIAIFLGKAEDGDELLFDYDFTEDEKFAYQYFCDTSHQVTHWQPLPRPPKRGADMKKLTQDIFKNAPEWVRSAAVDDDGWVWCYSVDTLFLSIDDNGSEWIANIGKCMCLGNGYDTTNWQQSAIDREVKP